ncbi:HPr kinase [Iodidimonas muriae]|uniref:HPr kinase n=2 Tax=Iodidimonas muriae TaxID=261467 RepID=A0ABQ2LCN5_9PROT|nr:HPr kinase [Kordiimonadales bacterium JCM 17843]GGO08445.1 HPr kinase [Iodidimonas muriae]
MTYGPTSPTVPLMTLVHASCVALERGAVLLRGPSGSGKSDLALRLIDGGALLVADDYVALAPRDGLLMAHPPEQLRGLLEVRGIGLVRLDYLPSARIRLIVDLLPPDAIERLPKPQTETVEGVVLPRIALTAFEPSASAKVRMAFTQSLHQPDMPDATTCL